MEEDKRSNDFSVITEKGLNARKEFLKEVRFEATLTTGHGIPRLIQSKSKIFKTVWLLCLFGSTAMCVYMVWRCINQYLQYQVVTVQEYVDQADLTFPVVSFCNVNPLVTKAASEYVRDSYNEKYNVNITTFKDLVYAVANGAAKFETDWLIYQTYDLNFNKSLRVSLGFDQNGNPVPVVTINKEGNGLFVQLFIGLDDSQYDYMYEDDHKGIVILVDDQPNVIIKNKGIINSGVYSKVFLTKTLTELLPSPYGVCLYDNQINTPLAQEIRKLGYNYSRKNCITFCEQQQTIQEVGCYDMTMPQIYNAKPCDTQDLFDKLNNLVFNYTLCYDDCPFECATVSYSLTTSLADYPSYNFYLSDYTQNRTFYDDLFEDTNLSYSTFYNGIVGVFVGFDKLRYTHIADAPSFEIMDIFANVGGTLGLFLGVSLLSTVELIDLLYRIATKLFKIYKTRSELRREEFTNNQESNL